MGLYANVEGRPSGDVGNDVQALLKTIELPPGYRFDVAGQQQDMEESFTAAVAALGMAVIFIYIILASQFGSFLQPLAIMASLPFTLIGVFLALLHHRHHAQHLLDHRHHHADGPGDQERDPAGGLHQPGHCARASRATTRSSTRARCACARS